MTRGWRRLIRWTALVLLLLFLLGTMALVWPVAGDTQTRILQRKGTLQQVRVERRWREGGVLYSRLTLVSDSGLEVALTLRRPAGAPGRLPAVVLLGGLRTGREAAHLVTGEPPLVVAALSYPYRGPRRLKGWTLVRHVPTVQRAVLDTAPALLLALDYVAARSFVDPDRMELVGVSLGAFFVAPAAALDPRVRRLWLIQGAGDPAAVLEYQLRDDLSRPWLRKLAARLLLAITDGDGLAPERWLPRVAPRPVVVVSSRNDAAFPPAAVAVLHAAVRPPGEVLWMEGGHIRPGRKEIIERLNRIVIARIIDREFVGR